MNLFESNFMNRSRRLPQKKRSFLLDVMEQTRLTCKKISENPLYQRYPSKYQIWEKDGIFKRQKRELNLAVQMGSVAVWMVLEDGPQKRDLEQVELRLREIDRLVMHHGFHDMYEAVTAKIEGTIFDETHVPSGEIISKNKQKEYERRIMEYINLNGSDRKRFIAGVTRPYGRRRIYRPVRTERQRES